MNIENKIANDVLKNDTLKTERRVNNNRLNLESSISDVSNDSNNLLVVMKNEGVSKYDTGIVTKLLDVNTVYKGSKITSAVNIELHTRTDELNELEISTMRYNTVLLSVDKNATNISELASNLPGVYGILDLDTSHISDAANILKTSMVYNKSSDSLQVHAKVGISRPYSDPILNDDTCIASEVIGLIKQLPEDKGIRSYL